MSRQVKIDQVAMDEVKSMLGEFGEKYKSVMVTSINKTLGTAQTQAVARIGNELNLTAARIKEDFYQDKANYSKIAGGVIAKGEPVGLIQFGANQTLKGVSVKVLRANPRTLLKHAFIAARGTKEHVFWRQNRMPGTGKWPVGVKTSVRWDAVAPKYRIPLERLTGPRIEDIYAQPKVFDPVTIQANHVYLQNVEEKVKEIIRRYA
jgi:hypothetical protein